MEQVSHNYLLSRGRPMTSFRLAPIIPIAIIIILAAILWFVAIPMITINNAEPQTTVKGLVLHKTISGTGGTVTVVDEANKDTKTLTIQGNQDFNNIQQFKRYSFTVRGTSVMYYLAI